MSYNKETGMYEGYIYLATNVINNKKYVGQTITDRINLLLFFIWSKRYGKFCENIRFKHCRKFT